MMNAAMWRDIRGEVIAAFFLAVLATASSLQPLTSTTPSSSILPTSTSTSTSTLDLPMTPVSRPFHPASSQSLHNSRKPQMFEPDMQDPHEPCPPFDTGWAWGLQWALGHGLTVGALKWAVKGAHLSLPTTLALLVARKVSPTRALLHGVAQVIGAAVATPVLLGLLPRARPPRPPVLQAAVSPVQAWGAEFLASMVVTLIMLSAHDSTAQAHAHTHAHIHSHTHASYTSHTHSTHSTHTHGSRNKLPSPTASSGARMRSSGVTCEAPVPPVGVVMAANAGAALFVAEFAGIGLVPTRSTAVAIVTGSWTHHWVYWVGPMLGGLLGAFTHDYTGWRPPEPPVIIPKDVSRPSALSTSLASPC